MSNENYRIAVLGDQDSVLGFKALGLDVYPAETVEAARETLHRLARENTAIIYLTEELAAGLEHEIARYKDALTPAIILIPGKSGSLGIGMANVKKSVERAVGADILGGYAIIEFTRQKVEIFEQRKDRKSLRTAGGGHRTFGRQHGRRGPRGRAAPHR